MNWHYRYKRDHHFAIRRAYAKYLVNSGSLPQFSDEDTLEYLEFVEQKNDDVKDREILEKLYIEKDENEYIYIRGHNMLAISDAGVYYDDISESWRPIPDNLSIS